MLHILPWQPQDGRCKAHQDVFRPHHGRVRGRHRHGHARSSSPRERVHDRNLRQDGDHRYERSFHPIYDCLRRCNGHLVDYHRLRNTRWLLQSQCKFLQSFISEISEQEIG